MAKLYFPKLKKMFNAEGQAVEPGFSIFKKTGKDGD